MNKALLLVDIQNDFCPGGALAVNHGDEVVPVANAVLPLFQHCIASQDWHPRDHVSFNDSSFFSPEILKWPAHCVQQSTGAALHPNLKTDPIELFVQKGRSSQHENFSMFSHDLLQVSCDLEKYLKSHHITDLYVMGLATECCVQQTVLDALKLGFRVTVIEDGIRGIGSKEEQEASKEKMRKSGARFVQSGEMLKQSV